MRRRNIGATIALRQWILGAFSVGYQRVAEISAFQWQYLGVTPVSGLGKLKEPGIIGCELGPGNPALLASLHTRLFKVMPPRRRPQSVRGIVRDHLELIERNREYGIAQWATLEQLGLKDVSLPAFRDALYRARQGLRAAQAATTAAPYQPGRIPAGSNGALNTGSAAPRTGKPLSPPRPLRDGENPVSASPKRSFEPGAVKTPRDFLDLVRSTKDEDII